MELTVQAGSADATKTISSQALASNVRFAETMVVFPEERKLVECIRNLGWGEITVKIKDGLPVMGHRPIKDIKFTDNGH